MMFFIFLGGGVNDGCIQNSYFEIMENLKWEINEMKKKQDVSDRIIQNVLERLSMLEQDNVIKIQEKSDAHFEKLVVDNEEAIKILSGKI